MDKQSASYARLSFNQNQTSPLQIYSAVANISYRCFGSQVNQVQQFNNKFVRQLKWLSQTQFRQIESLCWALPGPTTLQMIITMVTLKTKSILNGIIAFIIFSIPSWIAFFILGWISQYSPNINNLPVQAKLVYLGFVAASSSMMFKGFLLHLQQLYRKPQAVFIVFSSASIFVWFRSSNSISFCLIFGTIFSLYTQIQNKKKMSQKSQQLMRNTSFSWILGKTSIYTLIGIYFVLWIYFSVNPNSKYIYAFIHYFAGCFIVGPISTVFPYFYANFSELHLLSDEQLWLGIAFAFMVPGNVINVGIYYGAVIDGIRGVIISATFLYLPCFLTVYGILPSWRHYRNKPGIQRLIIGLTSVASGLVLGTVILSLQNCIRIEVSLSLCLFCVGMLMSCAWDVYSVLVVFLCGLLANTRRWGLVYYRVMIY